MQMRSRQRGITLVVAMLMLIVVSMFAVASFNSSTTNARVTGNMINRQEGLASAQYVINQTISSPSFASDPDAAAAVTHSVDLDQDGAIDYQARISPAPSCDRSRVIKSLELNTDDAADLACMTSGVVANSGVDTPDLASTAGDSLCANTQWNVRAIVEEGATATRVAVNQGVGIRVLAAEASDHCI